MVRSPNVAVLVAAVAVLVGVTNIPGVMPSLSVAFAEFEANGLFRPVFWFSAATEASPTTAALVGVGTAMAFLWVLRGFGVGLPVSALVVMLWTFHPLHVGVWQQLDPAESWAIPFALVALECARRAARPRSSKSWEVAWLMAALLAILSRNAFIGIVPAVALARLGPDELTTRANASVSALLCGAMLLLGGVGLSSTLSLEAQPELTVVALGGYVLFAAFMNGMADLSIARERRAAWVGVGTLLVATLAWNLARQGGTS